LFVIEMKTTISVASVAHSVSTWLENHTYLAQKLPWSRWRCFQDEAQPLHWGWVDSCDYPKCG